jgi:hypothetical protein
MLPNQVPVSFFARGSKLLQDFRDLRQGRPFNERDASSASSALSLDCGPVSAAPSFGLILVGASLTRAASAELVRRSLFASDLILPASPATKAGIYVESGVMLITPRFPAVLWFDVRWLLCLRPHKQFED